MIAEPCFPFHSVSSCKLNLLSGRIRLELNRHHVVSEGIATVCIAPLTPLLLTDDITRAKWLNEDERRYLSKRIKYDRMGKDKGPFQWRYLHQAFRDWKVWAYGFTFFAGGLSTYGMSFALPTIIRQLGYTAANAQLMTIPVYFAAFLTVSISRHAMILTVHLMMFVMDKTLTTAYIQDKTRRRVRWIIIPCEFFNRERDRLHWS